MPALGVDGRFFFVLARPLSGHAFTRKITVSGLQLQVFLPPQRHEEHKGIFNHKFKKLIF